MSNRVLSVFRLVFLGLITGAFVGCGAPVSSGEASGGDAPARVEVPDEMETAVLGAGCFWCVEVFYERLEGVHEVVSGYAGGGQPDPDYEAVSRGETDHAEVVRIIYDPEVIGYRELIDFFWTTHDPTRADGVWPDFGRQYRSILLYQDEAEEAAIKASREAYEQRTGNQVATEISALREFYPAETYHQDFAERNPDHRYVRSILNPKLEKLGFEPVE